MVRAGSQSSRAGRAVPPDPALRTLPGPPTGRQHTAPTVAPGSSTTAQAAWASDWTAERSGEIRARLRGVRGPATLAPLCAVGRAGTTMRDIQIRRKLQQGKAVSVVSGLHNVDMAEYLAQLGLDGVWIECEHGPVSWEQIGDFSRACDLWDAASIVRVTANEPWLITRTLDRGASGIVVPHVSTRAEAERVVESAKFGPLGRRGMFGGRRSYGVRAYHQKANDETLVVVLIEEVEAIQNLAEILTVD